ncbi:MAG: endonuclease domain-containing protein [Mariprofundales bacterium]
MKPYPLHLKSNARRLRSHMTDAEQRLWKHLRRKQLASLQFYRQKPLANFIVDFYCATAQLVIELDGGQHFSEEGEHQDQRRDAALQRLGLKVLRFDNLQVMKNIDGVLAVIVQVIESLPTQE